MRKTATILALSMTCLTAMAQRSWELIPLPNPLRSSVDTVSVHIIGDVMMHSKQLPCDCTTFLADIVPEMRSADISVANMEFPLGGAPYTGYPSFSTPDYYARYIAADCGADILLTANNHILDRASSGLVRTLCVYDSLRDSLGTLHTGSARHPAELSENYPLIVHCKGISIAVINFTYGTNSSDGEDWPRVNRMRKDELSAAFGRAKARDVDFIIALPHWGEEYSLHHSKSQMDWAEWLVEQGADVIVGSHPHVVQDTTHINGVPVVFSLGNAVSNMSAVNTRLELSATLRFVIDGRTGEKHMLEPQLDFMWCTLPGKLLPDSYATIYVKKWATRKSEWLTPSDYDNMVGTLERVKAATGISD